MCSKAAFCGVQQLTENHLLGEMGCHPCIGTILKENRICMLKSNILSNRKEMFPTEKYWVHFLCVWGISDTLYCKGTVAMNGNLSQDVEAGLDLQSLKLACFQQSVLSVLNCDVTAVVTWLLFYLAGSGASSPLTSPSSPTPPSTAGKFKNHYSIYLFFLLFFYSPLPVSGGCYSQGWLRDDGFQGWNREMTVTLWQPECGHVLSFEGHREPFYSFLLHLITFLEIYMMWFTQGVRACFEVCVTPGLPTLLLSRHFLGLMLQYAFVLVLMVCWLWNTACSSLVSLYCLFIPVLLWCIFRNFGCDKFGGLSFINLPSSATAHW